MPRDWADVRIVTYNIHRSRGWTAARGPSALRPSSPRLRRTSSRSRKSSAPGLTGPGHAEVIGAALGMGWIMAPARELRRHQFGNAILSRLPDPGARAARPVLEDLRAAQQQRASIDLASGTLHVYNVHLGTAHCWSAAIRRRGSPPGCTTGACTAPGWCSATSTNGAAAS